LIYLGAYALLKFIKPEPETETLRAWRHALSEEPSWSPANWPNWRSPAPCGGSEWDRSSPYVVKALLCARTRRTHEGEVVRMSYGHADKIIHGGDEPAGQQSGADRPPEPAQAGAPGDLAPDWYAAPELAPVLAGHDVCGLYRWLNAVGVSQRRIAALVGSTQPQVADIITGRRGRVRVYEVLVRIAAGLKVPRERMGLSFWGPDGRWYGPPAAYPGGVTVANIPKGVTAEMLRRHLIAWGGTILAGVPVAGLGELVDDLGDLDPVPLPSRLSPGQVMTVRDLTRRLAEVGNDSVCDPQVLSDAAARMSQLLGVPGPDPVVRALKVAVAELRIEAGWAAFDAGFYRHALYHFARAVELATQAGDPYCQSTALGYAGMATVEHGYPDDGLKMLQQAQVTAWSISPDDQRAVVVGVSGRAAVEAGKLVEATKALVRLGALKDAVTSLVAARDLWIPTRTDPFGDMDRPAARVEIERGRLDIAEQFAAASMRRWEGGSLARRTETGIVLATIHVKAGEPRGLQLAHDTVTAVSRLSSGRLRRQLVPLAAALEARPGSDARELARMARQVAA